MPQGTSEPIRLKFIRSTIDPRSILVDEELNPHGFDEIYDWAQRKINFVVIDADTGEDITRILLAQNRSFTFLKNIRPLSWRPLSSSAGERCGDRDRPQRRDGMLPARLSRTYATLLEALNRHRGKGQQKVTVEHVHVHAGGQAVVGMVAPSPGLPGGRDRSNLEEQPHAKQIAHAPEPALPSPDAGRDALPVARDAERALPDARRQGAGRAKGK
jgi:hypothetical protein